MGICTNSNDDQEYYRLKPFAVPFGWLMLGGLLMTCNCTPVQIIGAGFIIWAIPSILRRLSIVACCLKQRLAASSSEEKHRPCYF